MRIDILCDSGHPNDTKVLIDGQPIKRLKSFQVVGVGPDQRVQVIFTVEPVVLNVEGDFDCEQEEDPKNDVHELADRIQRTGLAPGHGTWSLALAKELLALNVVPRPVKAAEGDGAGGG